MSSGIIEVSTQAYSDQKPGTSGLRKKVEHFEQPNYVENFIQSILDASKPKSLVVGGDGRYFSEQAIKKIISVCAANGLEKLYIGRNGILSTPACSALIRSLKTDGGILLTASHNPGGPTGDFGIKFNTSNGGAAPESLTNKIYDISCNLDKYKTLLKRPQVDISQLGTSQAGSGTCVQVIDPVEHYLELMRQVFDFDKIKALISSQQTNKDQQQPFKIMVDCLSGVMGPYAKGVLVDALGAPEDSLMNATPLPDFGGHHPDPNLVHAKKLLETLANNKVIVLGCAFDGDGDRNMILGSQGFFVNPCDSVAIIAANHQCIKYFRDQEAGIKGLARSLPTSQALDKVAQRFNVPCYETPTGWKFFCNLLEAGKVSICGEESFGTSSDHILEKDGMWALLAWLSIMAETKMSVVEIVHKFWADYGRFYYLRQDYENLDEAKAKQWMKELETLVAGTSIQAASGDTTAYKLSRSGSFKYTDPVDASVSASQGIYLEFESPDTKSSHSRVVVRLSGTGSSGATARFYFSECSSDSFNELPRVRLSKLIEAGVTVSKLKQYFGATIVPTLET